MPTRASAGEGTAHHAARFEAQLRIAAVSAGVNVLALARMLGHKDPSVTLRVYADLFDTEIGRAHV